jgi:hypothetical protein
MAFRSSIDLRRAGAAVAVAFLIAAATEGAARAGEPDAEEDLHRGVVLRREGKDAEALKAFEHALATSPSARARAQVALAEQALALWLLAERDLVLALEETDDPWIRQNREALERATRVVAGKLAWISVGSAPAGAKVFVNGMPASPQRDGRIRVVAGQVGVELRAEGRTPASRTVQVAPETTVQVALGLGAPLANRPADTGNAPAEEGRSSSTALRTTGWALTGAGVVALGVGGYFGVHAVSKKDERDADCKNGCTQAGVDADRAGRTAALVSTIAIAAGAAATAVGIYFVVTSPSHTSERTVGVAVSGTSFDLFGKF